MSKIKLGLSLQPCHALHQLMELATKVGVHRLMEMSSFINIVEMLSFINKHIVYPLNVKPIVQQLLLLIEPYAYGISVGLLALFRSYCV